MRNNCQNHRLDGLKDFTDCEEQAPSNIYAICNQAQARSKKSVKSASSVTIRDSDKVQKEIDQYLTQLTK